MVAEIYEKWQRNPMTKPRIGKVAINISLGKSGEPLEKASKLLEQLAGQKPCFREAKQTIKDFGIRRGEPMACLVTLRKNKAKDFLKKAFSAVGNKLSEKCFDDYGNFAFGIREHIELPGVRYDPELGIVGMDFSVNVEKPGYRVKRKKKSPSNIGKKHKVSREEAILFLKDEFGIIIGGSV